MRWSLCFGTLLLSVVYCQVDPDLRRLCNFAVSCRECILADPACVWCADTNFNGTRCYPIADTEVSCPGTGPGEGQQAPSGGVMSMQNVELVGFNQVSPATVSVSVRPGVAETFPVSVRPARDFPIDLYLLMDLSFSMRDDLANLQVLGADLAASIVQLSANFSIGFGSFVEKVAAPFTTLNVASQLDPCTGNDNFDNCDPTYSYRHVISLTSDANRFTTLVQNLQISGNQDLPEGGFDGFLQSLLCTDIVGWRPVSRRLLLYITDAGFHFAGDGKLAGIVRPHPNQCLLMREPGENVVEYDQSLVYDYPSVGQIAQALREQDIIPIFAAEQSVREFYDALATELGEGAFVGTLESDSSNVVELVELLYNTISQRVVFDQEPIPGVSVTANPIDCPGIIFDGICEGVEIERRAEFDVSVSVTECTPQLANGPVTVPLRVVGFGNIDIVLTALCECPCENNEMAASPVCNMNGNLTCGICECNEGNFGEFCQCDANQAVSVDCPLGENGAQCTGRGTCQCGICDCQENFFGPACECDQRDCINQDTGLLCSGRGTCGCNGQCTCNVEPVSQLPFFGDLGLCECTPNTQNCRDPNNRTVICNGNGQCGCDGNCECNDPFLGTFCERCSGSPICVPSVCNDNRECANCALDLIVENADTLTLDEFLMSIDAGNPTLPAGTTLTVNNDTSVEEIRLPTSECIPECSNGAVIISGALTAEYDIDGMMAVRCEEDRGRCTYRYFVAVNEFTAEFTAVHVEYIRSCTEQSEGTAPWIIAIGIIIPLLVLGVLLLLLLKLLLLLVDYVEVRKFENDIKNTKYSKNENPLYRSAAKDYQNPIYGQ